MPFRFENVVSFLPWLSSPTWLLCTVIMVLFRLNWVVRHFHAICIHHTHHPMEWKENWRKTISYNERDKYCRPKIQFQIWLDRNPNSVTCVHVARNRCIMSPLKRRNEWNLYRYTFPYGFYNFPLCHRIIIKLVQCTFFTTELNCITLHSTNSLISRRFESLKKKKKNESCEAQRFRWNWLFGIVDVHTGDKT